MSTKQKKDSSVAKASENGQILLLLLLILSVALVVALGLIQSSLTRKRTVRYEDNSLRAYYAAEAGLEDAIPRLEGLKHLSGQELDTYLEDELVVKTPQTLSEDTRYAFTRDVERESVWEIERTIGAEGSSQFDLSDAGEVSLENSEIEIKWDDPTCSPGPCQAAVEAILVWVVEATENDMFNPSFEEDDGAHDFPKSTPTAKWSCTYCGPNSFNVVDDTSGTAPFLARYGHKYEKMTIATSPAGGAGLTRSDMPVERNTSYTLSVYAKVANISAGGQLKVGVNVWDSTKTDSNHYIFKQERYLTEATGTEWERIFYSLETDGSGVLLQPFFYLTEGATGTVYLDGAQLEKQARPSAYCDGGETTSNCAWYEPIANAPPFQSSLRADKEYKSQRAFYNPRGDGPVGYFLDTDRSGNTITEYVSVDSPSMNRALRLKSMYSPVKVYLRARSATWPDVTYKLVGQEIIVSSTGYFADTKKTVQASHGLPSLMPQFDYVLYNYGCAEGVSCVPRDLIK